MSSDKIVFTHEFELDPPLSDFTVCLDPPEGAKIQIQMDEEGVFIGANKEGWLHLARVCAELGGRDYNEGYHIHRKFDFSDDFDDEPPILTLGVFKDGAEGKS